jgi:hypothetical protein
MQYSRKRILGEYKKDKMEQLCITNGARSQCMDSKTKLSKAEVILEAAQKMARFTLWRKKIHSLKYII